MEKAISEYMAQQGRKGRKVNSQAQQATARANGAKGGAPTKAERAERKAFFEDLEKHSHNKPVIRAPWTPGKEKLKLLIAGHKAEMCIQAYSGPADPERAAKGLETGLISYERRWVEIDGQRVDDYTYGGIKKALGL